MNLVGVAGEQAKSVLRFDQFQAIAGNGNAVVTVGGGGALLVSRDGGQQWQRRQLPGAPSLIDVVACPDRTFAALDIRRTLWLSADDGDSWNSLPVDTTETPLALTCDPRNGLWAVGSFSTILHSNDRGVSWEATSLDEDLMLTTVQFVDASFGVITGEYGTVLTSVDGGVNWERAGDLPEEFYPLAALFTDADTGYIGGLNGQILHTADGGQSWERQPTATDSPIYGLLAQGQRLYAVGDFGTLLTRRGDRWVRYGQDLPAFSYLRAIAPSGDHDLLLAGGAGALFRLTIDQLAGTQDGTATESKP
ncbi:MAG TPA: YCF48-related protein [Gammaproteobacteria bacterium]